MNTPHTATRCSLPRRAFLRGLGVTVTLPLLEAMTPAFVRAAAAPQAPQRFVAMCATLGFHTPFLFPTDAGRDYALTPYLEPLKDLRRDFTVLSGVSHAEQNGANGHTSHMTWLTSAKHPGLAGFKNTISLDQLIAEKIGIQTRFPYLALSTTYGGSLSWTASGVQIPGEVSPSRLFRQLFENGTPAEVQAQRREIARGRSILDTVLGSAKRMQRDLGGADRQKLDEYLTSVRELETRLVENDAWAQRPKPKVEAPVPTDVTEKRDAIGRTRLLQDVMLLALQNDSTRTITIELNGLNQVPIVEGVTHDWHNLSHHGLDPAKIEELKLIETAEFRAFAEFLAKLKATQENGRSLLDQTAVLFGSNLGNASAHSTANLPLLLAGGGYRHGQHLAFDAKNNVPFANLFVTLAQRMGVEIDKFGYSTGAGVKGLELA